MNKDNLPFVFSFVSCVSQYTAVRPSSPGVGYAIIWPSSLRRVCAA